MPKCTERGKDIPGKGLCLKCKNKQKEAQIKQKMDAGEAQRQDEMREMAEKVKRRQDREKEKQKEILKIKTIWNGQINVIVTQVRQLRSQNQGVVGINAGKNQCGDTQGGTDCPLELVVPQNQYGITKADVLQHISGFESSDSGLTKIRRQDGSGDIFIHLG